MTITPNGDDLDDDRLRLKELRAAANWPRARWRLSDLRRSTGNRRSNCATPEVTKLGPDGSDASDADAVLVAVPLDAIGSGSACIGRRS
jgi:hypothetical protein